MGFPDVTMASSRGAAFQTVMLKQKNHDTNAQGRDSLVGTATLARIPLQGVPGVLGI